MSLKVDYREVSIHFSESDDAWYFHNGVKDEYFHGLKPAKAAVDKMLKRQYVPIPVFRIEPVRSYSRDGAPEITQGMVTRPTAGACYRFVPDKAPGDKASWSQEHRQHLFLRTPENQKLIPQYVEACVELRKMQRRVDELLKQIQVVPAEMEVAP